MKNLLLIFIAVLLVGATSFAQKASPKDSISTNSNEYKTIFSHNGEKPKVSGFAAVNMDFGKLPDKLSFNIGGDMAVLLNRSIYFGVYGRAMTTLPTYTINLYDADSNQNFEQNGRGMFFHGGLIVGGIYKPTNPIHFGFSTKIGWGGYTVFNTYDNYEYYDKDKSNEYYSNNNWVFAPLIVITPQLDVEMNINYWFKLRLGVGYQWVSSSSMSYETMDANNQIIEKELFNTSDLSSPTVSIGFVFGWFK